MSKNWGHSKGVRTDREFSGAVQRLIDETRQNVARIAARKREVEAVLPVVRVGHDTLLSCEDGTEQARQVNAALNASLVTYGFTIERRALDAILDSPELVGRLSDEDRAVLGDYSSYLRFAQRELHFMEMEPFQNSQARAPSVTFDPVEEVNLEYSGQSFAMLQRQAKLAVPVSLACTDNQLMKGVWLWERLQGGLPALVDTAIVEMEEKVGLLEAYL